MIMIYHRPLNIRNESVSVDNQFPWRVSRLFHPGQSSEWGTKRQLIYFPYIMYVSDDCMNKCAAVFKSKS